MLPTQPNPWNKYRYPLAGFQIAGNVLGNVMGNRAANKQRRRDLQFQQGTIRPMYDKYLQDVQTSTEEDMGARGHDPANTLVRRRVDMNTLPIRIQNARMDYDREREHRLRKVSNILNWFGIGF